MAKKILVLNSPWGRHYERPSDCQRWIAQGHASIDDGVLSFTQKFFDAQLRSLKEGDPVGFDDGVPRRWAKANSGGIPTMQLLPIVAVGPGGGITPRPIKLTQRGIRPRTILQVQSN